LGVGQRIIEPGAFFELGLVERRAVGNLLRGFAALNSHGLNLAGDPGGPSDGECGFAFAWSHASNMNCARRSVIQPKAEVRLGVCLTNRISNCLPAEVV